MGMDVMKMGKVMVLHAGGRTLSCIYFVNISTEHVVAKVASACSGWNYVQLAACWTPVLR